MSDHDAQLLIISKALCKSTLRQTFKVNYEQLGLILSGVDWLSLFSSCMNVDDYAERFTKCLLESIHISSRSKYVTRRIRLPKFIVSMLRKKKKAWKKWKSTGDAVDYIRLRKEVRAAIRQHRRNQEERIISSKNARSFFTYVNEKMGYKSKAIKITVNGAIISDSDAAEMMVRASARTAQPDVARGDDGQDARARGGRGGCRSSGGSRIRSSRSHRRGGRCRGLRHRSPATDQQAQPQGQAGKKLFHGVGFSGTA